MKRKRGLKPVLALLLALVLALGCTGCGAAGESGKEAPSPLVGYWVCTGLDIGEQLDEEGIRSLLGMDPSEVLSLHLSSGGQAEIVVFGERFDGSWTETENGGQLTIPGEDSPILLALQEDGTLSLTMEEDGQSMPAALSPADSRPEVFDREPQPEPEEIDLPGFWTCTGLDMGFDEVMDEEGIASTFGIDADSLMSLRLRENGTAWIIYFGEAAAGVWEETEDGIDLHLTGGADLDLSFYLWPDGTLEYETEEDGAEFLFTLEKTGSTPKAFETAALPLLDVSFSPEQTRAMSNYMLGGNYLFVGDRLFGFHYYNVSQQKMISFRFDASQEQDKRITDFQDVDMEGGPTFLQEANGCLYYICTGSDGSRLCRINPDGSGRTVLYDKDCSYLQVCGDVMYFTDENHHLVRSDLDGQNVTTLIAKELYYTYCLGDDWFLFQDDADGESLHIANLKYGFEQRLSTGKTYCYVVDGNYLYFVDEIDNETNLGHLTRIDLDTMETQVSEKLTYDMITITGDRIYSNSYNVSVEKENWKELDDEGWDLLGYRVFYLDEHTQICMYWVEGFLVDQYAIYSDGTFTTF